MYQNLANANSFFFTLRQQTIQMSKILPLCPEMLQRKFQVQMLRKYAFPSHFFVFINLISDQLTFL